MKLPCRSLLALGLASCAATAMADETGGRWQHTLHVYGMGAAIEGDTRIGSLSLPIDLSISEKLDALRMGGMAAWRADNGSWSFTGDLTYMDLGWDAQTRAGRAGGTLGVNQFTAMATVGRRLNPRLEVLGSLAYFDLDTTLEVQVLQQSLRASRQASWVDPLVGLQYAAPLGGKWSYSLRGDVGGFGIGSEFTWHAVALLQRQVTDRFGWYFGYRAIAYDYRDGGNRVEMHYDVVQHGPGIGAAFSF